jgi:predicted transcriptional regulator
VSAQQSLEERVEELAEKLDDQSDHLAREVATIRQRVTAVEDRLDRLEDGGVDVDDGALQELREDVDELRAVIDTGAGRKTYEQMTRQDKVRQVQATLLEEAEGMPTGKAAMEHNDVKWLFNGHPGNGTVYDLMKYAGQEDGFNYQEREENNRVTVDENAVPDSVKTALEVSRRE